MIEFEAKPSDKFVKQLYGCPEVCKLHLTNGLGSPRVVLRCFKLLKVNSGCEFDSIDKVAGWRLWLRGLLRLVGMLHGFAPLSHSHSLGNNISRCDRIMRE